MTIEDCTAIYESIRGKNDIRQTVFFEGTPDEQKIFVPGWSFSIEDEKTEGLYRANGKSDQGGTVLAQDEKIENLPEKIEKNAMIESLNNADIRGSFIFCLLAGRLILLEDTFNCIIQKTGWEMVRDNIKMSWDQNTEQFTVLQDNKKYYETSFSSNDTDYDECIKILRAVTSLISTSITQDELLFQLTERYPDFEQYIQRHIDLYDENSGVYQIKVPSSEDDKKMLWIFFDEESAGVGIFPCLLGDDIGLHIDSVGSYIGRIMNEEVILCHLYKNEEQFDAGNFTEETWKDEPKEKTREAFEKVLASRAKGLGKMFNKNKVYDTFSWNGKYTMTVKI